MAIARDSLCSPLPAEIWGTILTHIDDLGPQGWVVCRQVSQMLRSEAQRLQGLNLARNKPYSIHCASPAPKCHNATKVLPATTVQLWAAILSQVDDFTLWTSCHPVSSMFRGEAERELAAQRFKSLRLTWSAHVRWLYLGSPVIYRLFATTTDLKSIGDSRASFGLNLHRNSNPAPNVAPEASLGPRQEMVDLRHRLLLNSDRNVGARLGSQTKFVQICSLGACYVDIPVDNPEFEYAVSSSFSTGSLSLIISLESMHTAEIEPGQSGAQIWTQKSSNNSSNNALSKV